jgi:hypothetical protein
LLYDDVSLFSGDICLKAIFNVGETEIKGLTELHQARIDFLDLPMGHSFGVFRQMNFFRLLFHLSFVILLVVGSSAHFAGFVKNVFKHLAKNPLIEMVENATIGFFNIVLDLEYASLRRSSP